MYSADTIAVYVINTCNKLNIEITNLKLQKLLYFIQYEVLLNYDKRLIEDDFYAWKLGPVIPSVYYKYTIYSSFNLPYVNKDTNIANKDKVIILNILSIYANKDTWYLVNLSKEQDPYKYNYQIFGNKSIIPYQTIVNFVDDIKRIEE